jgi:prepilin-type N-terminal cleavage/methylation domain-containing protein
MNSPCTNYQLRAFTLIEVLVVIAILSTMLGFVSISAVDEYRLRARLQEQALLTTALILARSRAMDNYAEAPAGVAINPPGYRGYVVFSGPVYGEDIIDQRVFFPAVYDVALASSSPSKLVFTALTGTTSRVSIVLIDPHTRRSSTTTINHEGYIE